MGDFTIGGPTVPAVVGLGTPAQERPKLSLEAGIAVDCARRQAPLGGIAVDAGRLRLCLAIEFGRRARGGGSALGEWCTR